MNNYKIIQYNNINEICYEYSHKSGLKAYVVPKKGYSKKYAAFATKYGSMDNEFIVPSGENSIIVPDGIAHFLEHKLFEQEDGSVMDKFAALGSSPNAYTSFNKTAYLFSCTDQFNENLKLLIDYVQNPYLTDENVEKEKGIIAQEIMMYEDDPEFKAYYNLLKALYAKNPVRNGVAGTKESVMSINRETLMKCYDTFYHPSNMMIIVVGDLIPEEVFDIIDAGIKASEARPKIERIFPEEPEGITQKYIMEKVHISAPIFEIGIKCKDIKGDIDEIKSRSVAMKLIMKELFDNGSEVYERLFKDGLINDSFGFDFSMEANYSHAIIGGESRDPELVREIITEYIAAKQKLGLVEETFNRNKKAYKGSFLKRFNSVESIASSFISEYFRGTFMFDYYDVYDKITIGYANKLLSTEFDPQKIAMSVVYPI